MELGPPPVQKSVFPRLTFTTGGTFVTPDSSGSNDLFGRGRYTLLPSESVRGVSAAARISSRSSPEIVCVAVETVCSTRAIEALPLESRRLDAVLERSTTTMALSNTTAKSTNGRANAVCLNLWQGERAFIDFKGSHVA